ncbi:MAG: ABC transporter permease [Deltaproteobacteria bacterium]|nr:ABC transporter permease [Deltaproteobacteria bacterium]
MYRASAAPNSSSPDGAAAALDDAPASDGDGDADGDDDAGYAGAVPKAPRPDDAPVMPEPTPETSATRIPRPLSAIPQLAVNLSQVPVAVVANTAEKSEEAAATLGATVREAMSYLGALSRLTSLFLRVWWRRPFGRRAILEQCEAIGIKSVPIALLILFFVGLVFALQFGMTLQTMGAVPYVGKVTSLSIMRELGPVFTALVVGGRVGAGIAAEIGSMRVTEQVDAIRALGADPIKKLVVPRVIAATIMLPIVALFADIIGIIGGMIISYLTFDVSLTLFYKSAITTIHATDFLSGFVKPFFFGFGIALIGCLEGLTCGQGTEGVGRATTRTVVNVSVMVVLVDFFLTKVFMLIPRI